MKIEHDCNGRFQFLVSHFMVVEAFNMFMCHSEIERILIAVAGSSCFEA